MGPASLPVWRDPFIGRESIPKESHQIFPPFSTFLYF
jgi:hypothetical protein